MSERYDVIVIGAGLGGLSSAAYLARKGHRVLLLERHNIPGGYATSFVRGRYEFEASLHELSGLGRPAEPSPLNRYFDYLGISDTVEFSHCTDIYRSVFPSLDITLPMGREAHQDRLCQAFPHERRGIKRFLCRIFTLDRELERLRDNLGIVDLSPGKALGLPLSSPNCVRYLPATWGKVLDRDIQDQGLKAVISQYWGYFGLPPSQLSFFFFALGLASYIKFGAAYPKGRAQNLSNAFIKSFEASGGSSRFGCGVKRILVDSGQVCGVITDQDEHIEAGRVISNADPLTTCLELVGEEKVKASFFSRLRSSRIGPSSLNVYLGIAKPPEELGLTDHEIFINDSFDTDSHFRAMCALRTPEAFAVTCYNGAYPEISPPGTSMVVLTTLQMGAPWYDIAPQDYRKTKNRLAEELLLKTEKVLPGLREYIEVLEVSTPLTNIRYSGNPGGSIYGFCQSPYDHTILRVPPRGPLKGLFFTGAWSQPGGGYEPAIISGLTAGRMVESKITGKRTP